MLCIISCLIQLFFTWFSDPILVDGNPTVPEENGTVRVCVRLQDGITTDVDIPVTFNPFLKNGISNPTERELIALCTYIHTYIHEILFVYTIIFIITANTDFDATSQTVILRAGETVVCIDIAIVVDGIPEGDEEFCVEISSDFRGFEFGDGNASTCDLCVTITDPPVEGEYYICVHCAIVRQKTLFYDLSMYLQCIN